MKKYLSILLLIALLASLLTGCGCDHEWEDATCEEPETCEKCGETRGDPDDHSWKAADCENPKTCKYCKKTKGKALGHDWEDGLCTRCNLVEVPDFAGSNYENVADYPHLTIEKEEVYDDTVPAGQIISQKTKAGKTVKKDARVVVVVSLGPKPTAMTMPDLQNRTLEEAEKELQRLGLSENITVEEEYNNNFTMGAVIRTTPAASATLSKDAKITLVVSKGKKIEFGTMPKVVGQDADSVRRILDGLGLDLNVLVEEVYNSDYVAGIVIETTPGDGEKLQTNDTVIIRVSKGTATIEMPCLTGLSLEDSKALLKELGFTKDPIVSYTSGAEPKDTVRSQLPQDGLRYSPDTTIYLQLSDGSLAPKTTTKNVVIDLKGYAQYGRCMVSVKRDEVEVLLLSVPKGTTNVTLYNQEGYGTVYYTVTIDDYTSWIHAEYFTP